MYKKTGIIQITEDLKLKDFQWEISGARYDWKKKICTITVSLSEGAQWHSREFSFSYLNYWTEDDCLNAILALAQFKDSL